MKRIDDLNLNDKKIIQDTDLFLFGMDSVLLANKVKGTNKNSIIVDLGTGSCVIPVIISQKNNIGKIIGVELQDKMYELAKENIEYNNLQDKICILKENLKNVNNIKKYLMESVGKDTVEVVVSNPPYKKIGTGSKNELDEKYIARHEVECELEDVFKTAAKLLKYRGKLYIVHKPERIADLISLARKHNLEPKEIQFLQPTTEKKPSIVMIEYVLGGGNECIVLPSLIEYDNNGNYTKDILDVYDMDTNTN